MSHGSESEFFLKLVEGCTSALCCILGCKMIVVLFRYVFPNLHVMYCNISHGGDTTKYGSTFYVGMVWVKKVILYLHVRYRSNFVIAKAECYKSFTNDNLSLF